MCKKLPGKTRCKFHGGASTGPRSVEGKRKSALNLVKAREVIESKSPEWFQMRSQKSGKTRSRQAMLRKLYGRLNE